MELPPPTLTQCRHCGLPISPKFGNTVEAGPVWSEPLSRYISVPYHFIREVVLETSPEGDLLPVGDMEYASCGYAIAAATGIIPHGFVLPEQTTFAQLPHEG